MKVLIFADNHFCERYSLVSGYGIKYSTRLENQLQSIAWVEEQAKTHGCDFVVCLGDFFDKPQLTDQELTALREIVWEPIPHYFLVGNHESEQNNLQYSSTKALEVSEFHHVISTPELWTDLDHDCEFGFLPFILECDRKALTEYFPKLTNKHRIIFSHNELKGIQMGPVVSKTGFVPEDFNSVCNYCINGHLHNGQKITDKVINLGNLTGKDFGEDATRYLHQIMLIDTVTLEIEYIENPYAFQFYKLEILEQADLQKLSKLKDRAVVSIQCAKSLVHEVKDLLQQYANKIVNSRVITAQTMVGQDTALDISELTVDHHSKFAECCREKLGSSDVLEAELAEVLK